MHFVGVLIVVGVATIAVVGINYRGDFLRLAGQRMASHAAVQLADKLDDPVARDRLLKRFADEYESDITLRTPTGELIAHVGPELPQPPPPEMMAHHGPGIFPMDAHGPKWSRPWFAAAPVIDPHTGVLRAILAARLEHRFHAPPMWRPGLWLGLVLLIAGLGVGPLARRISRPLERLTEATRRFGEGDLKYRLPSQTTRHGDELGELTVAWNDMATRIEGLVREHKELLANVSHELRSPLARLRMALELLPLAPGADGETRVRDMETDLAELDHLIDDLLTSSRLEATAQPLRAARVTAGELFDELLARAARDPLLAGKAVSVEESADRAAAVDGDRELLVRALWNLIENAAKYGAPPITLSASRADGRVALAVADRGNGIPLEERERVFTPFYKGRADAARTPSARGGFGLGLTLARRIAVAHEGTIAVSATDPASATGCRVVIDLPAAT